MEEQSKKTEQSQKQDQKVKSKQETEPGKEKDNKEKDNKEKDNKEKDNKEKDNKEKDNKEKDNKEKDNKEKDNKEKDNKEKEKGKSKHRSRSRSSHRHKKHDRTRKGSKSNSGSLSSKGRHRSRHRSHRHRSRSYSSSKSSYDSYRRSKRSKRERRRRKRSPSVSSVDSNNSELQFEKRRINLNNAAQPAKFWDGFQWVVRTNAMPTIDPMVLSQTAKMRRIQLNNIPLNLDLTEIDIIRLVAKFLFDNFLNDSNNLTPIISCQLNMQQSFAILEMSSVEEASRLIKVETIKIFNNTCKITRVGEAAGQQGLQSLVTQAQTSAQAQAAAMAAIQMLTNKDAKTNFSVGNIQKNPPSKILKITNIISIEKLQMISDSDLNDTCYDISEELKNHAQLIDAFIIKPQCQTVGATAGTMFAEFANIEEAQKALIKMTGRTFDSNEIKLLFIPENFYYENVKELKDPNDDVQKKLQREQKMLESQMFFQKETAILKKKMEQQKILTQQQQTILLN